MYTTPPKKLLILIILDILQKYSDENHRLSQKEIENILESEYSMKAERKSIKRNLMDLIEFGYNIEYSETVRSITNSKTGEKEDSLILSDFYLIRDFTDSELRLLIDSLIFSKHIPYKQCAELISKLEGLSCKYFSSKTKHIKAMPDRSSGNKQLFYTIEILDEAISNNLQVSFNYCEYGTDKKLHIRLNKEGKPREYIINPYQIAATNGRYYLICNYDKYDDVSNYRLDRIKNIRLLTTKAKPMKQVIGLEHGFRFPKHMAEHIYMSTGKSSEVLFSFEKHLINDVIDWFGNEIIFCEENSDTITAKITVNLMAMRKWALQYALYAKVLSPKSLAQEIQEDLKKSLKNYSDKFE